jgi:hypothetical protein
MAVAGGWLFGAIFKIHGHLIEEAEPSKRVAFAAIVKLW